MISAAFGYALGTRRTYIANLKDFMKKTDWGYPESVDLAQDQIKKIEGEIIAASESAIAVVEQHLIPKAKSENTKILCLKMQGD